MREILVVDDSDVMRALYKHVISRVQNCKASFATTGKEALDHVAREGEPSLIILDVNMPVMDGLECLERLKALGVTQRVPIVMVTTEGSDADIKRGLDGGASEYLRKPFRAPDLLALIERRLAPEPDGRA